jgi:hypothetical protein
MSERSEQIRAAAQDEAAENAPLEYASVGEAFRDGFQAGAEWADANPRPHTIACEQLGEAEELLEVGADLSAVLSHLGIGVED